VQDLTMKTDEEEEQLPKLLGRQMRQCKTLLGSKGDPYPKREKSMVPQRKTIGDLPKPQSSKSLSAEKEEQKEMCQLPWGHYSSAPNQRAFPVAPAPLVRWRAAVRIKEHLKKWRGYTSKGGSVTSNNTQVMKADEKAAACSSKPYKQLWPEEPAAPTCKDLEALSELETLLLTNHITMEASYKHITTSVKSCNGDTGFTKRDLKIALHLKYSKEEAESGRERLHSLDLMFDSLLALLRKGDGSQVLRSEFLQFPELLKREKELQSRLLESGVGNEDTELLLGSKLRQRFAERLRSPEQAKELLEKAAIALQIEPCRTANLLCQLASSSGSSSATSSDVLASGISSIMRIVHIFGEPNTGSKLDVLVAGWTLCSALTKHVARLGTQSEGQPSVKSPSKTSKMSMKFKRNSQVSPSCGSKQDEVNAALWKALPPGEVLWNLGCGAEVLSDEDFKTLLRTAWSLFDSFDVVGYLLGPVGLGRLRPKLASLADLDLQPDMLASDPEHAQRELTNAGVLLQQIESMVEADPRLARIAALFATSYLVNRIRSTANSSVNLVEGAAGSAAAQVNRSASALAELLSNDVEELMGGRQVQVCLSSGQYTIIHAEAKVANPLATWHQDVTAQVLKNARVKQEVICTGEEGDHLCMKKLDQGPYAQKKCMKKCLQGYNNMQ